MNRNSSTVILSWLPVVCLLGAPVNVNPRYIGATVVVPYVMVSVQSGSSCRLGGKPSNF